MRGPEPLPVDAPPVLHLCRGTAEGGPDDHRLWIWLLIRVYGDIFGRRDIGGGAKTGWVLLTLFLPLVGCLIYLISQGRSMTDRAEREAEQQRAAFEEYVKSVAAETSAGDQTAKARTLLADGAITQQEFERMTATANR
jgi:hypothetical protein